ncbi:GTPase [Candidatus Nanopelagicus limnes]|uniref:GTPase Era n=1 Tax=Candidatus Nanopelagicus limnae TaxID=1884634 RepID=A0A249JYB0_9ACTN|nr:GTPase Era [Candidatus Nanopelagicus limnes]ASY09499.1 GTPase [Candidatus Nanopelagicus limnes]
MENFKAGFVAIVGRPNTGKSTLVNALVGTKIVITSHHPNTTRNPIRGIINREKYQMIVVDTPGMHKPKTALGTRLNSMVNENMQSNDAVLLCLPADEEIGAGDEYIAKQIKGNQKVFLVVTKVDKISKSDLAVRLMAVNEFALRLNLQDAEIIPVSAKNLDQTELLLELLSVHLPESPALYPTDINTDQAQELMFADLIREAAIEELYEELPHSVMVTIEEMGERDDGKIFDISATLHVERDSQKGIIIGPQGSKLKAIGSLARKSIENLVGMQVFLQIHVKVSKEWQKDPKLLAKLGFTDALSD